jgi:hypothetical protein
MTGPYFGSNHGAGYGISNGPNSLNNLSRIVGIEGKGLSRIGGDNELRSRPISRVGAGMRRCFVP